jgi:uncharacterized protein YpuA (DUF1002 family)
MLDKKSEESDEEGDEILSHDSFKTDSGDELETIDPLHEQLKIEIPEKSKENLKKEKMEQKRENARVSKWKEMLEQFPFKLHNKLKSRGRKGIPDSFRNYAWCLLSDVNSVKYGTEIGDTAHFHTQQQ